MLRSFGGYVFQKMENKITQDSPPKQKTPTKSGLFAFLFAVREGFEPSVEL